MTTLPLHSPVTRFCLVRHGETDWNVERRLQGHLDVPLNPTGVRQAQATADSLSDQRFDHVYSSDLLRARMTAETIGQRLRKVVTPIAGLRERHYGNLQALTYPEAETRFPEDYALFIARDTETPFSGGGESLRGFAERIAQTLSQLARQHAGETVLVVTHGGVLDAINRLVTGKPLHTQRDFVIPNAALNWIEHHPDGWRLIAWADQSHLQAARDEIS